MPCGTMLNPKRVPKLIGKEERGHGEEKYMARDVMASPKSGSTVPVEGWDEGQGLGEYMGVAGW